MSDIAITAAKKDKLAQEMAQLGIIEDELVERFILGSGAGGQKVNKTSSCVYIKHIPSGIEVKCQRSRSRELNRFYARRDLCDALRERIDGEKSRRRMAQEKIRRQKRRRSRRSKARMLEGKRRQGEKKALRARVNE